MFEAACLCVCVSPCICLSMSTRVCVCVCVCVCVDLCYQEDTGFLQQPSTSADRTCENFEHVLLHSCRGQRDAEGLISRPLPTKLREVETGRRTCSGRHGHISAACGHKHHVVQSVTMHVHVILA